MIALAELSDRVILIVWIISEHKVPGCELARAIKCSRQHYMLPVTINRYRLKHNHGEGAVKKPSEHFLSHGFFSKHITLEPAPKLVLQAPVTQIVLAFYPENITQYQKVMVTKTVRQFTIF